VDGNNKECNKIKKMKKLFIILIATILFTGCYDEFRLDHTFSSVAFSSADGGSNIVGVMHRTVVKNEGLKLDIGINLTGIIENKEERWAEFAVDPGLMAADEIKNAGYELMPSDYYTFSGTKFIINPGSILGKVTLTLDSAKFVNDPKALNHVYALPLILTSTSEDSINANLNSKIIVIKYINHFEGFYDQTGTMTEFDVNGNQISSSSLDNVLTFTTLSLDSVITDGMFNMTGKEYEMKIIPNADNSVYIANTSGSAKNSITPDGNNTYDASTSTFNLNYKVTSSTGAYKKVSATLKWRNRIRDGINEWRR
jgi:hypothetical protein